MNTNIFFGLLGLIIVHTIMLLLSFSVLQELGLSSNNSTLLGAVLVNSFTWSYTIYKMNQIAKRVNKELKEARL